MLALLAIEGERSGYDLMKAVDAGDRAHLVAGAERSLRGAAAARQARPRASRPVAQSSAPTSTLYRITPAGTARARRLARDRRAGRARHVLPQALRRRADDARRAAAPRRAVRRRLRGTARASTARSSRRTRTAATTGTTGICSPRARAHRAGARLGGRRRARASARAAMIAWTGTYALPASTTPVRSSYECTARARPSRSGRGTRRDDRGRRHVTARTCASRFPACRRTSSSTDPSTDRADGPVRQGRCAERSRCTAASRGSCSCSAVQKRGGCAASP